MRKGCWWGFLGVGTVAVYAGFRVFTVFWDFPQAADELPQAIRDFRAAGLPWTAADLAGPKVPPSENAALSIRQALAAWPRGKDSVGFYDPQLGKAYADGTVSALFPKYEKALRLVHDAAQKPKLDFERDWDQGMDLEAPEPSGINAICRMLAARAESRALHGEHKQAMEDLEDIARLASLLATGPSFQDAWQSAGCRRLFETGMRACLAHVASDLPAILEYRRLLIRPLNLPDQRQALRHEIYGTVVFGRNLDRYGAGKGLLPVDDFEYFWDTADDLHGIPRPRLVLRREGLPENVRSRAYFARCLQLWTGLANATHGFTDGLDQISQKAEAMGERASAAKALSYGFSPYLFGSSVDNGIKNRTTLAQRALSLAFADALILHTQKGAWPIRATQTDPLGKGPLRVRFDGKRFRVWSVGRNGIDEDGLTPSEARAAGKKSDDLVAAYPLIPRPITPRSAPPPAGFGRPD